MTRSLSGCETYLRRHLSYCPLISGTGAMAMA